VSIFDDALSRGWQVIYALEIEGLPYTFCERVPTQYDSYDRMSEKTGPGGDPITFTSVDALVILDNVAISQEIDRQSGIAGGRSVDFYLNYDAMGLHMSSIFRRPNYQVEITANLLYNGTTANVEDTTGWGDTGFFYIGKEYVRYGGKTSNTFTGLLRGEINEKYNFRSTSFSSYRFATDTPLIWRGRKVTLFEHLVTPDGYALSSTWCDTSAHATREIWKGFIDAVPTPDPLGMKLRCMPYQRQLAKEIGYSTTFDMIVNRTDQGGYELQPYKYAIVSVSFGDVLNILCEHADGSSGVTLTQLEVDVYSEISGAQTPTMMTRENAGLYVWQALIDSSFSGLTFVGDLVHELSTAAGLEFGFTKIAGYEVTSLSVSVPQNFVLFEAGTHVFSEWIKDGDLYGYKIFLPWRQANTTRAAVILHNMEGTGWQDTELASSGLAIIEANEKHEVVQFLKKTTKFIGLPYDEDNLTVVVLTERGIGNTPIINLFDIDEGTFTIGSGFAGDLKTVLLTLMESSGTTQRGSYDTLPTGFGYGINSDDIDEATFTEPVLGSSDEDATCVAEGSNNLDDLIGGWIAVHGNSVASRMDTYDYGAGNTQKITVVDWHVVADDKATVITASDVIMGQTISPKMLEGPNSVELETAHLESNSPSVVVRDIPRIQSEGARSVSFSMPSVTHDIAALLGASYAFHSDGLSTLRIELGPHVTLDVGDTAILALQHPSMYDWETGTNKPAGGIYARVVQIETHLTSRSKTITFLMAGNIQETLYLCPSAVVASKPDSTSVVLTTGHGQHFIKDTNIMIYNRGGEADGDSAEYLIAGSYTDGSDTITVTSTLASWVGAGSIVTHPTYGNTEAEHNQSFAFVKYDRRWTG